MDKLNELFYKKSKVPADYEEHESSFLLWPFGSEYWRDNSEPVQKTICDLADIFSSFEDLYIGIHPSQYTTAIKRLPGKVKKIQIKYDDIFIKDIFPTIFFKNGKRYAADWRFNGWGGYLKGICSSWEDDDAFGSEICKEFGIKRISSPIICEGGALCFDGNGSLYLTRNSLLNRNRNQKATQESLSNELMRILPIDRIIWIQHGLMNDETDGHIDNLMAVVNDEEILLSWTDDPYNIQFDICRNAYDHLSLEKNLKGNRLTIYKVPIPNIKKRTREECSNMVVGAEAIGRYSNEPLMASYINFTYVNNGIILPVFDCEEDQVAIEIFKKVFKNRQVITFYSRELLLGGGNIHCASAHLYK